VRVLVTGAGGQVGHELQHVFSDLEVIAVSHQQLDVTDRKAVTAAVKTSRPDVVLHAAAWTAVDACEAEPERAHVVNALATRHVAEAADDIGASVCYFSTDYVFDGMKTDPYVESDPTNPLSAYGRTKLDGERAVLEHDEGLVVRMSWVCGLHGQNMVKTILRLANENDRLQFVDDQRGHPTFAADAARMVRRLVEEGRHGVFHLTNQGAVSWFEFARAVLDAAGLDPNRVEPVLTAELQPPRPALRPANSVLDNAALRAAGIPLLPDFHEPLDRLVTELISL